MIYPAVVLAAFLNAPALAAAPQAAPAAKTNIPFQRVWEPFWGFAVELPKGWKVSKSGFQGSAGGAVEDHPVKAVKAVGKGAASLSLSMYYSEHPDHATPEAFIASRSKGDGIEASAPSQATVTGMPKPGSRFDVTDKTEKERTAYAVVPGKGGFWVFSYTAPAGAYDKYLPAFDHLLESFKFLDAPKPK